MLFSTSVFSINSEKNITVFILCYNNSEYSNQFSKPSVQKIDNTKITKTSQHVISLFQYYRTESVDLTTNTRMKTGKKNTSIESCIEKNSRARLLVVYTKFIF